jgi:hypothetical protein
MWPFAAGLMDFGHKVHCPTHNAQPAGARSRKANKNYALERDELRFDRHPALAFCLSMIFSENRRPLFRIML